MSTSCLFWFRHDLRLSDNPGLSSAAASGKPLILLFSAEPDIEKPHGGGSRWWLDKSLRSLATDIEARGGRLTLTDRPLSDLVTQWQVDEVHWNRRYDPGSIARDRQTKAELEAAGVRVTSHNGSLLNEPWTVKTGSGGPYRVFTPYWKSVRARQNIDHPLAAPARLDGPALEGQALNSWGWHPTTPDWSGGLKARWTPGEAAAQARLNAFLSGDQLAQYGERRNCPSVTGTSSLSPYLRHGEISPRQIWSAVQAKFAADGDSEGGWTFLSEVAWREFSYHLLYHFPDMVSANFNKKFDGFPWVDNPAALTAWQRGETGYPLVDAGMRELYATGWMHNRVRMIVGSFLVKHLLTDWREGERWFWDCLVDADPASNIAGWQWVAGSGADASPYFRIFNPISQGEKFAAHAYVRKWVPEVAERADKKLFEPRDASIGLLPNERYPKPLVEHGAARTRALEAYQMMKEKVA